MFNNFNVQIAVYKFDRMFLKSIIRIFENPPIWTEKNWGYLCLLKYEKKMLAWNTPVKDIISTRERSQSALKA